MSAYWTLSPYDRPGTAVFLTNYMDSALFNLDKVIRTARRDLARVDFDTLVGTGLSGAVVIPALARSMKKDFVLIRKEKDDSHHGSNRLLGRLGTRWIFVDDLVASGRTRDRVMEKVAHACVERGFTTTHVGDYLYCSAHHRFTRSYVGSS